MHFAYPLHWWLAILLAGAIGGAAFLEYRRPLSPLTRVQRGALVCLRTLVLALLILLLFRPIVLLPPSGPRNAVVPILVDVSRSMRLSDADGQSRLARATTILKSDLLPALAPNFATELYGVGETLAPATVDQLAAGARRTDLSGALAAVRERHRGQRLAGIILLSDGGDTGSGGSGGAGGSGEDVGGPPEEPQPRPNGRREESRYDTGNVRRTHGGRSQYDARATCS